MTAAEEAHSAQRERWFADEGGYNHIQGTKPQTLSYGLNDSPAGVCAWIVEKWRTWSDCNGDVESVYTKDELLTTVTIYWVTQTIGSSVRMYRENQTHVWELEQEERVPAPAGMAMFPQEIARPPREWAERSYDVRRWQEMPRAATSPPSRNRACWPTKCANSSASSGRGYCCNVYLTPGSHFLKQHSQ